MSLVTVTTPLVAIGPFEHGTRIAQCRARRQADIDRRQMPRFIGIRCGVKFTTRGRPAAAERPCSISGAWRWASDTIGVDALGDLAEELSGGVIVLLGAPGKAGPL